MILSWGHIAVCITKISQMNHKPHESITWTSLSETLQSIKAPSEISPHYIRLVDTFTKGTYKHVTQPLNWKMTTLPQCQYITGLTRIVASVKEWKFRFTLCSPVRDTGMMEIREETEKYAQLSVLKEARLFCTSGMTWGKEKLSADSNRILESQR